MIATRTYAGVHLPAVSWPAEGLPIMYELRWRHVVAP